jgi:hypothetical protein
MNHSAWDVDVAVSVARPKPFDNDLAACELRLGFGAVAGRQSIDESRSIRASVAAT